MHTLFRFAHISDLHFSKLTWDPTQLFSKRWLGNLNLLLKRKHAFATDQLTRLFPLFHERNIDTILITGDLTSTSHPAEFELAQQFIRSLREEKFKVFTLPGNHDQYTSGAYKKQLFYQFFEGAYGHSYNLKQDGLSSVFLGQDWWLVGLDTAIATSLLSSNGYFSPELQAKLEQLLEEIPADHNVILLNHFPIFSNESARKSLLRKEALKAVLERFPKIKLFLHGHTHRQTIADLRSSHLPIMLDSGSAAQKVGGTWNFIEISTHGCDVEVFKHHNDWQSVLKSSFKW